MTVIVVGAGPVGLSTALLLARWKVPSVVCEARSAHRPVGSRSICTQRDVLDIFDRIGCAKPMLAEGVTWRTGRTFYQDHELLTVHFPDPGDGNLPPWINISQASVERYLLARVAAEPLVDLRWGHEVTAIDQDGEGVAVHTTRGVLRADYVVGADGARSAVRELVGVSFPGTSYGDRFLIADIRADLPFPNERRFHFDPVWNPGRQVLVHQCPGGVWRIDWQVPPTFDLQTEERSGGLDTRVRRITGDRPYETVWRTVYRFHQRCAERFRVGRVFLAGDAAHLFAPFGARGMNSGLQDAENLAWKLAYTHRGWGGAGLLESYHVERHAAAQENLRVTTRTMRFLAPQSAAERSYRDRILRQAVCDPEVRCHVDSGKLAEPYWYVDSPLTTPDPDHSGAASGSGRPARPVAGVLCPDAPYRSPDGRRTRLRQLFGSGFVVLSAADNVVPPLWTEGPIRAYRIEDDRVCAALDATPRSVHLVRPDGHLAAVVPRADPRALAAAIVRACGG